VYPRCVENNHVKAFKAPKRIITPRDQQDTHTGASPMVVSMRTLRKYNEQGLFFSARAI
jgi:hypothetical protein